MGANLRSMAAAMCVCRCKRHTGARSPRNCHSARMVTDADRPQPRQPQRGREGLRQPFGPPRHHPRRLRRRAHRRSRPERRRQVDAAALDRRHRAARRRRAHALQATPTWRCSHSATSSTTIATIREVLVGERADHEWAGDSAFRRVLDGLLGGVELRLFPGGIDTPIAGLSGGERDADRAGAPAARPRPSCLLLDEPTNHLDVEGVDWLAASSRRAARLDARRHARPLVPRRRLHGHLGAVRRPGAPVRRRLRRVRARARRA